MRLQWQMLWLSFCWLTKLTDRVLDTISDIAVWNDGDDDAPDDDITGIGHFARLFIAKVLIKSTFYFLSLTH